MATLNLRIYPDPMLRKKAVKIDDVGDEIRKIINQMKNTMYANHGIGLAAPQIGISKRVIIIDVGYGLITMINPEIVPKKKKSVLEEGCLSLPGRTVQVERPQKISVAFRDEGNKSLRKDFDGLAAKAIQHEVDHLNGRLIIDYLPWYKKIFSGRRGGSEKCLQ